MHMNKGDRRNGIRIERQRQRKRTEWNIWNICTHRKSVSARNAAHIELWRGPDIDSIPFVRLPIFISNASIACKLIVWHEVKIAMMTFDGGADHSAITLRHVLIDSLPIANGKILALCSPIHTIRIVMFGRPTDRTKCEWDSSSSHTRSNHCI